MTRWRTLAAIVLAAILGSPQVAHAEDAVVVEVGDTGLYLPNNAYDQDKHYLKQDADLLGRIGCLLEDVDCLLAALHALPPELDQYATAAEPAAGELAQLNELALAHNPALKPYRSQLAVLAARTRQAGAKPDPMVMFNLMNFPLPQFSVEDTPMTQFSFGWSQKYETYGKRGLKRSIAQLGEELQQLEQGQAELKVLLEVSDLYFAMLGTRARLNVLADNVALLELLLEFGERKYAIGVTPQAQVLQAELQRTALEQRRIELEKLLARQQEMLKGLLGHAPGFDPAQLVLAVGYPLPRDVAWEDEELLAAALKLRPDHQWLDLLAERQDLELELAHRAYRPDYTVSASYGVRWGKRDFFSAGVSVPLFTHKAERQDAALQEAYASQDVTATSRRQLVDQLSTRLGTLRVELGRIVELSTLYRTGLVPQARLALDSALATYSANQLDLSDLVGAQQALLAYELELEQLYIEYLAALGEVQLLTCGAFDARPYLEPSPAPPLLEENQHDAVASPGQKDVGQTVVNTMGDFYSPFSPLNKEHSNGP